MRHREHALRSARDRAVRGTTPATRRIPATMVQPGRIPEVRPGLVPMVRPGLIVTTFVASLAACEIKSSDFFGPTLGDVSLLPDITSPAISGYFPITGLTGPQNIDVFRFQVTDPQGSNGAVPSGVDPASIAVTRNGTPLAGTLSGNTWTGNIANLPDGSLNFAIALRDLAGNPFQAQYGFVKKNANPIISFTTTPQAMWSSADPSVTFNLGGTIVDPSFASATGNVYRPGADNTCGTADDVLWPKGNAGGQVSENTFDLSASVRLNSAFGLNYMAYNGVPAGGQASLARYCKVVRAADNAGDGLGGSNPNVTTSFFESALTWQPLAPTTGSIAGTVALSGGTPLSGVTVQTGTRTTQTAANGTYRFDNLAPGTHNVAVSNLPANVSCTPATKSTSVTAGSTSTVDFSCTQAPAFTMQLTGSYRHFTGFSRVCLRIQTTPAQPGAAYTAAVTGPPGGVSGSGQHSGVLDGSGAANLANDIFLFGTYNWTANVGGQQASTSIGVTSAPGTCTL